MVVKAVKQRGGLFIPNVSYIETNKNNYVWLNIQIMDNLSESVEENYSFQSLDDIWEVTKDIKGDIDEETLKEFHKPSPDGE